MFLKGKRGDKDRIIISYGWVAKSNLSGYINQINGVPDNTR